MPTLDFTREPMWALVFIGAEKAGKNNDFLRQPFTFCGVTRRLRDWIGQAKLNPTVVIDRVQRQGLTLHAALTKPDRDNNALRPLTPAEYEAEARAYRRKHTTHLTSTFKPEGPTPYDPVIETSRGRIRLGTYANRAEATYALNTAMTLLPSEWGPDDHFPDATRVPATQAFGIANDVEALVAALFPELALGPDTEVAFGLEE
jgi:hypothetical protein